MNQKVAADIIESILNEGSILYKLKLSNINLNDDEIMKNLLGVIDFYQSDMT